MLVEEQIQARQKRASEAIKRILAHPKGQPYGDYQVLSASGSEYRIAMRGPGLFDNYCTCPDFARNTLGTCKHIESILERLRSRYRSRLASKRYERERASVSLRYGDTLSVQLKLPANTDPALAAVAAKYFDSAGILPRERYAEFGRALGEIRAADGAAVIYSDVLDHVDRINEVEEGLKWEQELLARIERGEAVFKGLVKVPLFPYQERGALFAASRGRVVLADDMGLGKTIQTIAAAALLRRRRGIERVLVISPASVKYQWKTEIERFTDLTAQVIDGDRARRAKRYGEPAFFNLINYELVLRDMDEIATLHADLIVLDEAQRIRNWATSTARAVKQLKSRYAIVLTGTPLENKLEELYSVVEFVDGRVLGPAFRFLHEHVDTGEKGELLGYRGLGRLHEQLRPVLLRRKRGEVLKQLPPRADQTFRVPMTREQAGPYWEQHEILARLVRKWKRQGWLSDVDRRRLMCCLQNMRMICNSTYLFDKETNHSPKLEEFREIVRELTLEEGCKVVIFSEFQRMTHLAGAELRALGIDFVSLHGGVPTAKRGALMQRFREDPRCMAFLSTDAGGVGLNLQAASAVINFEPPWNPARLEQRIGRIHRMGQASPVQVIHMVTEASIEERVWETMRLKKALFSGLFDSAADEVSFEKLGRSNMLDVVEEVMDTGPEDDAARVPAVALGEDPAGDRVTADGTGPQGASGGVRGEPSGDPPAGGGSGGTDIDRAVTGLLEAGARLLEALVPPAEAPAAQPGHQTPKPRAAARPGKGMLDGLVRTDPQTNRKVMAIPMPENLDVARIEQAVGGLLKKLAGGG